MSVERRYSKRLPVGFEVSLGYRGRRLPAATARNLGVDGAFVSLEGIITLPTGTLVQLELHRHGRDWHLPAIVVHAGSDGIGLMFREPQPVLYRAELDSPATRRPALVTRPANGLRTGH
jgi:hypothetical protein